MLVAHGEKSICQLFEFAVAKSSLQATIPFTCIPDLEPIVTHRDDWPDTLTPDRCERLNSFLGQPAVVDVLDALEAQQYGPIVETVLSFLGYLVRNVQSSLPPALYNTVFAANPSCMGQNVV